MDRYGHLFDDHDAQLLESLDDVYRDSLAASSRPERGLVLALDAKQGPRKGPLDLHIYSSGRPDSNWRPSPWQGDHAQFPDLQVLVFSQVAPSKTGGLSWTLFP